MVHCGKASTARHNFYERLDCAVREKVFAAAAAAGPFQDAGDEGVGFGGKIAAGTTEVKTIS